MAIRKLFQPLRVYYPVYLVVFACHASIDPGPFRLCFGLCQFVDSLDPVTMTYAVKLESFEGPLDLLLHLIAKAQVDIKDIFVLKGINKYLMMSNKGTQTVRLTK